MTIRFFSVCHAISALTKYAPTSLGNSFAQTRRIPISSFLYNLAVRYALGVCIVWIWVCAYALIPSHSIQLIPIFDVAKYLNLVWALSKRAILFSFYVFRLVHRWRWNNAGVYTRTRFSFREHINIRKCVCFVLFRVFVWMLTTQIAYILLFDTALYARHIEFTAN